ncbi:MAG: SAM-dependent methyltransferase [Ktedonobacteraceae bacterium]
MTATPLQQLIIERISKEGPLTFAEYMRMALYEPHYGYYVTGPAKMGWEGDYYTSTDLTTFFANCLGRQLYQWWRKLDQPASFPVLEQGAGRGHLAQGVQAWAKQEEPEFSTALDYRVEDIRLEQDVNAPLKNGEQSIQTASGDSRSFTSVHPSVILCNELIDAFPVHIVEVRDEKLYEVYIDAQAGRLCEILDKPSTPAVAAYLERYKVRWQSFGEGWRAEINLDALRWMHRTAPLLPRGFMLVIDYGDKARTLYTQFRRRGTLACYFHHQMNERPLMRPGEQDITAHVNFSALIDEGRAQGFHLNTFTTQRLWLQELGIYEELEHRRSSEFAAADTERATNRGQVALLQWRNLQQRVAALTDPAGMGNFKVMILRR